MSVIPNSSCVGLSVAGRVRNLLNLGTYFINKYFRLFPISKKRRGFSAYFLCVGFPEAASVEFIFLFVFPVQLLLHVVGTHISSLDKNSFYRQRTHIQRIAGRNK